MMQKVLIVGAGAIATALGNVLAKKMSLEVTMVTVEEQVARSINADAVNKKYFPGITLEKRLAATTDHSLLSEEAAVFIAIPSVVTVNFLRSLPLHPASPLINLAKGFGDERRTIVECLAEILPNPVFPMKGPSFAREIINNQPTSFTLGTSDGSYRQAIASIFDGTTIHLDFTDDVRGVEILSILKNIYAIAIGVVDAQYESPNLKFMVFTRALNEMKQLLELFGGREETLFRYCGIGDFALTALNDLSRNRTLGLLIGKGFFTENISEKVVLEGRIAVNVFYRELVNSDIDPARYPIMNELYQVFNSGYDITNFVDRILILG